MQETIRLVNDADGQPSRLIGTVQDITEQHQAQALLRESEEKYRLLFEMSEDPMVLVVDQEIVTANRAAARALGFEEEQHLIGIRLAELAPEKQPDGQISIEKASAMIQTALEQGYHRLEWAFKNQDSSLIQVEVSLTRIPYVGKNAIYCIWRDIMEIKRIQEVLKQKSAYLDGILSSSDRVAIIATNPEGIIQYYNQTAEKLFGMPAEKAAGVNLLDIHRSQSVDNSRSLFGLERAKEDGEYRFTLDMRERNGLHHIDARVSPIYGENHEFAGFMLMCEDVTEQRHASELIAYQASYDALTDLPNRRMFHDNLQQAIARTRRHQHKGAVLFLDLDHFKNINDSLGHPVGDNLLQQVAQRMWSTIREEDTVARLGGDEFVILMPELSKDPDEAINEVQMLANKIRTTMAQPYRVDDHELHITTSIGITIFPANRESPDDILRQADTAMYRAKESGRNAVRFFLPSMQLAAEERHKILNELRQAIPRNELQVLYQPQFNVEKQLCSIEALLRWQHPKRGLVMPSGFIPQAEESSLILDIGDWVMYEALIQYKAWRTRYPQALRGRIAINVSALQFRQHDFIHKIKRSLNNTGADPNWLTLEMTESMLLNDFDETVEKIDYLKQLGVRFSIDDFGTGYSSLAYLKRLPVDEIKIDRSFVRDVVEDPNDAALVETIITLAQQTDLQTVAEGVETQAVFDFLRRHGCDLFQGFYLARPCDKNNFKDLYLLTRT
ncbi:MAG: EAL domain-containing protein [Candidatus Thiodiazotropha sp.]